MNWKETLLARRQTRIAEHLEKIGPDSRAKLEKQLAEIDFGELDSLILPNHPECDRKTGAVHACGHNAQSAALYALACAFAAKDALKGLCGGTKAPPYDFDHLQTIRQIKTCKQLALQKLIKAEPLHRLRC